MTSAEHGDGEGRIGSDQADIDDRALRVCERLFPFVLWPAVVALLFILVAAILYLIVQHSVNTQLGFDYATPQVSWHEEQFLITRVDSGGVMMLAGLRQNDHVEFDDVCKLYGLLICSQGGTANIPLLRDGRPQTVVVHVPPMKLPLPPGLRRILYRRYWAEMCGAPRTVKASSP